MLKFLFFQTPKLRFLVLRRCLFNIFLLKKCQERKKAAKSIDFAAFRAFLIEDD